MEKENENIINFIPVIKKDNFTTEQTHFGSKELTILPKHINSILCAKPY